MSTALLTIEQIKTMPEMVIPGVQGTLVDVKEHKQVNGAKGPTTVQNFKIQEGSNWILGDAWGMPDLSPYRGMHVIFVSNKAANNKLGGVSIKEKPSQDGSRTFKNLSLSSLATMHTPETYQQSNVAAPPLQAPLQQAPRTAPPVQQAPFVPKPAPAQHSYPAPSQPQQRSASGIQGITCGMAINNSVQILIESGAVKDGKFADDALFDAVHRLASGIIRVSQRLERGELWEDPVNAAVDSVVTTRIMNTTSERFEDATPSARARPLPGPAGSAFPQDNEQDDVPF